MPAGGLTWAGWGMVGVGGMLLYAGMTGQSLVGELAGILTGKGSTPEAPGVPYGPPLPATPTPPAPPPILDGPQVDPAPPLPIIAVPPKSPRVPGSPFTFSFGGVV